MKKQIDSLFIWFVLALGVAILAACVATPEQPMSSATATPMVVPATEVPAAAASSATATPMVLSETELPVVRNQRQLLARQLHIDPETIEIVSAEAIEWPDACMGVGLPNEICAQTAIPGYKIALRANGQDYIFHTDGEGYRSRVASAPAPQTGTMLMAWGGTFDNGECMEAIMGTEGVGFGLCGGRPQIGGQFVGDARVAVLTAWVETYAAFDAETDFGSVRLVGNGSTVATPEEQQLIGRWAQMVAMEAAAGESRAGMSYQGPAEMGSPDTSKCAMLQLGTPIEAGIGTCDGTMISQDMGKRTYLDWEQIRNRFAPFVYETETEKVIFEGMGSVSGEQWQRAILAWARTRYAELATGQSSATINTAMSWHMGQDYSQKNVCRHLTVLNYGYAYAEEIMCEGRDTINATTDWLTSEELAQLDLWLYQRAPLYVDQNYIDGTGTQEVSEAEIAEINTWAEAVWLRIRGAGEPIVLGGDPNKCLEPKDDLGTVRNYRLGYCLLVPGDYTVFDTTADEIAIVQDSLLNVTDPRLHIAVVAAEGRTAEEFAGEILAVVTGIDIQSSTTEIAGQPAVVIDNLPGQDINRRVLIMRADRIYDLTFTPMDNPEMESFYETIIANFVLVDPES